MTSCILTLGQACNIDEVFDDDHNVGGAGDSILIVDQCASKQQPSNSNLAKECRTDPHTEREGYRGDHIAEVELEIFKLDF